MATLRFPDVIVGLVQFAEPWSDEHAPVFAIGSIDVPDSGVISLNVSPIAGAEPVSGGWQILGRDEKVDLAFLRQLPDDVITHLHLDTHIVAASLPNIAHLAPALRSLVLQRTDFDDQALDTVARLVNLTNLQTWGNRFTDEGVQVLRTLSKLETLYLEEETLTARAFDVVNRLPRLRSLGLQDVPISDDEMATIRRRLPNVHVDR